MCSARATARQLWKDSASIILVAKTLSDNKINNNDDNYKLLMVKRSFKSTILPNAYVFPGGKLDKCDYSHDWLKLYERFGFTTDTFQKLFPQVKQSCCHNDGIHKAILKSIALRITAIRETFEECGILICRNQTINHYLQDKENHWVNSDFCTDNIVKWQEKVIKDPLQFYHLCYELGCYPDIWSLSEWSHWITPSNVQSKFNTVFFLAALQKIPPTSIDNKEIEELQWATPLEYLEQNKDSAIIFPPPQFYEISRLKDYTDVNYLLKFAKENAKYGVEKYWPYRIRTDEGVWDILPGDDLYPAQSVLRDSNFTYLKSLPEARIQHRLVTSSYNIKIILKNFVRQNYLTTNLTTNYKI